LDKNQGTAVQKFLKEVNTPPNWDNYQAVSRKTEIFIPFYKNDDTNPWGEGSFSEFTTKYMGP